MWCGLGCRSLNRRGLIKLWRSLPFRQRQSDRIGQRLRHAERQRDRQGGSGEGGRERERGEKGGGRDRRTDGWRGGRVGGRGEREREREREREGGWERERERKR